MLMSPSSLLARLDELKKWQQVQQERLMRQNQNNTEQSNNANDSEAENVSSLKSLQTIPENGEHENKNHLLPAKGFNMLLEDKFVENTIPNNPKPKRPFLKKGSGLSRYRMVLGDPKKSFIKGTAPETPKKECKSVLKNNDDTKKVTKEVPALKVPQMDFKPKARWCSVSEVSSDTADEYNKENVVITSFNQDIIEQINRLAAERLNIVQTATDQSSGQYSEKELLKFEALEKRVLNGSFCSTNSSVIQLMYGTPPKTCPKTTKTVQFCDQQNNIIETPSHHDLKNTSEASSEVNESEIIEQLISRQLQEGLTIQELLQKLQLFKRNLNEESVFTENILPDTISTPNEMLSISSCSSVNSEDIRNCIAEAGQANEKDNWENQSNDEDEATAINSSSTDDTNTEIRIIVKDATTNTESFMNDAEENDVTLVNKSAASEKLLMEKMRELEEQIAQIRLENSKVANIRNELEIERNNFKKEKKKILKELEDEKISVKFTLEEERKKLAKEKTVFEKYVKDLQNKPTKQERTELSNLKIELANLRETQKLKDSKNSMTQARLRNQIKSLEKENSNLKEEVEKLTKQNAKLVASQKITARRTDTKMLQEINKNVTKLTQEKQQKKTIEESDSETKSNQSRKADVSKTKNVENTDYNNKTSDTDDSWFYGRSFKENDRNVANFDIEKCYAQTFGCKSTETRRFSNETTDQSKTSIDKLETVLPDGSKETKYPNGNVKITSPDGNLIKTNYYNGDIKETDLLKGQIKYYYFETNTWQTTFADGTEILEFPNGQTEKKYKDGMVEVKLPDGIVKKIKPDGIEEIVYLDGSVVVINSDGNRTLLLPNGQKEIHTKDHKRREYPDGTVKILYPDGLQETRYANGRIRIKDKDGNLLMDSFS